METPLENKKIKNKNNTAYISNNSNLMDGSECVHAAVFRTLKDTRKMWYGGESEIWQT